MTLCQQIVQLLPDLLLMDAEAYYENGGMTEFIWETGGGPANENVSWRATRGAEIRSTWEGNRNKAGLMDVVWTELP